MSTPTAEAIAKLPKWAQDHINDLSRQRDAAVNAINESVDKDTPSPFYYEDWLCLGEQPGPSRKRHYVQASTINVEFQGIELAVAAREPNQTGPGIVLSWASGRTLREIAMIPESFQRVRLVTAAQMRI